MYGKVRASVELFGQTASGEFDHFMGKMPNKKNLARNISTSEGDLIQVTIPSDREARPVVTDQTHVISFDV